MAFNLRARYLQTNFSIDTIYLEDYTGLYNVVTNLTGYGNSTSDPNPSKILADQEIDGWELLVTRPDATTFSLTRTTLDGINASTFLEVVQIPITDTQDLINGEWTFKYDVNESDGELDTVTITQYIYNIDAIELIINRKFATEVDFCKSLDCACNNSLATLFAMYRALKAAIEEQNTVQANYLSAQIITLTA